MEEKLTFGPTRDACTPSFASTSASTMRRIVAAEGGASARDETAVEAATALAREGATTPAIGVRGGNGGATGDDGAAATGGDSAAAGVTATTASGGRGGAATTPRRRCIRLRECGAARVGSPRSARTRSSCSRSAPTRSAVVGPPDAGSSAAAHPAKHRSNAVSRRKRLDEAVARFILQVDSMDAEFHFFFENKNSNSREHFSSFARADHTHPYYKEWRTQQPSQPLPSSPKR